MATRIFEDKVNIIKRYPSRIMGQLEKQIKSGERLMSPVKLKFPKSTKKFFAQT